VKRLFLAIAVLINLIAGCAVWENVGGAYQRRDFAFQVELPMGWHRHIPSKDSLVLTRDGLLLQRIDIARLFCDQVTTNTKRKVGKGMLPLEVAEVIIDDFRSSQEISNFQIIESLPNIVGGYPGFKITYSYQSKDNLRRTETYYGALVDQWYYFLMYKAPTRHYYNRDLLTFEKLKASFKITL
jgi:hypothetical protein